MFRSSYLFLFSVPCAAQVDPANIQYVHVVSMNHLDVGFDGHIGSIGYAINVINKYFDDYFPKAIHTAQQLRHERGNNVRFIYTTHPWLVSLYLDCPASGVPVLPSIGVSLHCPNETQLLVFNEVTYDTCID